ncbi:MmgE/PrpD family protein [Methanobrevibacter curvatus]|uniref:2-methylcitrate dehydratase n=1 Tax=Methanobrevibacter curvatus TaxID=49547 RepID=A0A166AFP6_9EURY|nr:MmgE/PrpD family protein [Methanobrevibacter curvatus]KZX11972.1 2-methylcitrate dehydratase [Methanobrevibacter curvatus]
MIIKKLSEHIINLKYENIPEEVVYNIKMLFLDYLGVTFRGINEKTCKIAIKTIKEIYPIEYKSLFDFDEKNQKNNPILPNGKKYPLLAGFINGIAAHNLDFDDGHSLAQLHPGSIVFSTALALGEMKNIRGKKFIEAVVAGYETAIILGKTANPQHRNQGFHSSGTIGSFASAATSSKILNLNLNQTINSLALSGTITGGLLESDHKGTMGKSLHIANGITNGIKSSFLGKNGFTGTETIFDGDEGFLKSMSIKKYEKINSNEFKEFKNYLKKEFEKYHINEVYIKKYPVCGHLHSSIDSMLFLRKNLLKDNDFSLEGIENISKINVETYKIASQHNNYNPKNKEDLRQSLAYSIAIGLLDGDLNINNLNIITKTIEKSNILEKILRIITIKENNSLEKMYPKSRPSKMSIEFKNGKKIEKLTQNRLFDSSNSLKKEDILNKFKSLNHKYNTDKLNEVKNIENYRINDLMDIINKY